MFLVSHMVWYTSLYLLTVLANCAHHSPHGAVMLSKCTNKEGSPRTYRSIPYTGSAELHHSEDQNKRNPEPMSSTINYPV